MVLIFILLQNSEAMVSIDMPAGPSEVLVIADKYANPVHVAADLLSQVLCSICCPSLICIAKCCSSLLFKKKMNFENPSFM